MNKQRRKRISDVASRIEFVKGDLKTLSGGILNIKNELERILSEEESYFENMPENLQGSMRGEEAEEAIDYLTEAIDSLDEAMSKTEEDDIINSLEEAVDNLENI